jgi:hypothetical protein
MGGWRGAEARTRLEELLRDGSPDPRHLSYYGLVLAVHDRDLRQGVALCERALLLAGDDPQLHLNLAQAYERTGRRSRALAVLRRAIRAHPHHRPLLREVQRLSPRRPPVIGSLGRNHALNRVLGKLRARYSRAPQE